MIERYKLSEGMFWFSYEGDLCRYADVIEHFCWKPIESAPKEGQFVDVWNGAHRYVEASFRYPDIDDEGEKVWCHEMFNTDYDQWCWDPIDPQPTHWMHIPGAPR